MSGEELITVKQLPVITEQLASVKDGIISRTEEACSLLAVPDTLSTIKKTRAELNKQFEQLDSIRKAVKAEVMKPYEEFEAVFKDCVTDPFKKADAELKKKVGSVEGSLKKAAEDKCFAFWAELQTALGLDYVKYEQMGVNISLTDAKAKSPSKWFAHISGRMDTIKADEEKILQMENAAEVMVEFKKDLDMGKAIWTVERRKAEIQAQRAQQERLAAAAKAEAERQAQIQAAVAPPPEVLSAPQTEEKAPQVMTVTFRVTDTRERLIALREHMRKEGYQYE